MKTRALSLAVATVVMGGCVANSLPQWQSASEITVNVHAGGVVYTAAATDADGDIVRFRVAGELPAGWSLDAASGELTAAPRQTTDAPAGTTIELVAYDDYGGNSPLTLTVNFEYGVQATRAVDFPPTGSAINLQASEAAILLLANEPSSGGQAMTGVTLIAEDGQAHQWVLRPEGDYWQLPILLEAGHHTFAGSVQFEDGSSSLLADFDLYVNQSALQGEATAGQVSSGHQLSENGDAVYYLSENHLVRQSLVTGSAEVLWTFDHPENNYYFGVQAGEQKVSILEQKQPIFKLSAPTTAFESNNNFIPGTFTLHELDLAAQTITETGSAQEPALDYGPYVMAYDVAHHRFIANVFQAGTGASVVSTGGEIVEQSSSSLGGNALFALDATTGEVSLLLALPNLVGEPTAPAPALTSEPPTQPLPQETPPEFEPIAPVWSLDGHDNIAVAHAFGDSMFTVARLVDDGIELIGEYTGVDHQELLLDVDALNDDRLAAVASGLAYDVFARQGGLYSTLYIFNDGVREFKTQCDTSQVEQLSWQSPLIQPYPVGCINGVAYDVNVASERDMAIVTAINVLSLPVVLEPVEMLGFDLVFTGEQEQPPTIMQNLQAVSLITGQVVTLYSGY